jgi:hypothetical protein
VFDSVAFPCLAQLCRPYKSPSFKNKLCSEPRPGTNLRRSKDLATRFDDCISEPALQPFHRERVARNDPHSVQLRLKTLQKFSEPTIKR